MHVHKIGNKYIYNLKLVYVGCAEGGKTTNLFEISKKWAVKTSTFDTKGVRTLFLDFTQKNIFLKGNMVWNISIYSVPAHDQLRPVMETVLSGTDSMIFVADSSADKLQENIDSYNDIVDIMQNTHKRSLTDIPFIFQWNKRDLINKLPTIILSQALNQHDFPEFESIANQCLGVVETFVESINLTLKKYKVDFSLSPLDLGFTRHQMKTWSAYERANTGITQTLN